MRIGIIGTGYLGKIHMQCLRSTPFVVEGIFEPDHNVAAKISEEFQTKRYDDYENLLMNVDAVIISNPTKFHFDTASQAVEYSKHVLIEKPACESSAEVDELMSLAKDKDLVIQVGHVERYNAAYQTCLPYIQNPKFIEVHRLAMPNGKKNDVSVIMDLMIHDLDILLSINNTGVKEVRANGVSLLNESTDIANARIEFEDGSVANLTASRISMKQMRKMRLFQNGAYISVDYLNHKCEIIKHQQSEDANDLEYILPEIKESNAILQEQLEFYNNIEKELLPTIGLIQAKSSITLAEQILEQIIDNQSINNQS